MRSRSRFPSRFARPLAALALALPLAARAATDTAAADSLLPARLGPAESLLWGPHGWARSALGMPLTVENRERELQWRRSMLFTHQLLGMATVASMVGTLYYGQRVFDGHYGDLTYHQAFIAATVTGYTLTGLLALTSPPPAVRRGGWSTVTIHKGLAVVHLTGMLATPILGLMLDDASSVHEYNTLKRIHQITGYTTAAALGAAMLVVTF